MCRRRSCQKDPPRYVAGCSMSITVWLRSRESPFFSAPLAWRPPRPTRRHELHVKARPPVSCRDSRSSIPENWLGKHPGPRRRYSSLHWRLRHVRHWRLRHVRRWPLPASAAPARGAPGAYRSHASSITSPLTLSSRSSGTLGRPSAKRRRDSWMCKQSSASLESIHCACAQNVPRTSDAIAGAISSVFSQSHLLEGLANVARGAASERMPLGRPPGARYSPFPERRHGVAVQLAHEAYESAAPCTSPMVLEIRTSSPEMAPVKSRP